MKIKLKQAMLNPINNKDFKIVLSIQKKDKSMVEVEITEKAQKGLSIFDTLGDWWHSVKVDDDIYDVNIYHTEESKGLMKVVMYATKKVEGSDILEMVDHKSTSTKLRTH